MDEDLPDLSAYKLKVVERLGAGGTSNVFLATQENVGDRKVAVKIPKAQFVDHLDILRREITAIIRLRHPNIVVVYDAGLSAQPPYLVVELADSPGPDVPLSEDEALSYGVKLCSALSTAHGAHITHGDIKPQNILWRGSEPLLGDFGTAILSTRTLYKDPVGYTPEWMAPWHLHYPNDPNSDVWSTAAVVLFWITGILPHGIDWTSVPPGLAAALRPSMQTDRYLIPDFEDPALELGKRFQQRQFLLSMTFSPFPVSGQANWVPGPYSPTQETDVAPRDCGAASEAVTVATTESDLRTRVQPAPHRPPIDSPRRSRVPVFAAVLMSIGLSVGVGGWILSTRGSGTASDSTGTTSTVSGSASSGVSVRDSTGTPRTSRRDGGSSNSTVTDTNGPGELADLAFATDQAGNFDILVRSADGQTSVVVNTPDADTEPALSPDSKKVAFTSDKDGSHAVYLAPTDQNAEPTLLSTKGVEAESPAWSPDGRSLVWSSRDDGNWDIIKYDFDTGDRTRIVGDLSDDRHPSWSSDGSMVVFRSDRTGNGDIYTFDVKNHQVRRLTTDSALEDHPSMGPDQRVAFERWLNGRSQLFALGKGESESTRVTQVLDWEGAPAWVSTTLIAVTRSAGGSTIVADIGGQNRVLYETSGFISGLAAASGTSSG